MKEFDFDYENDISKDADLYSRGKALDGQYRLLDPHDVNQLDDFFLSLSKHDEEGLQHYGEQKLLHGTPLVKAGANASQDALPILHSNSEVLSQLLEKYIKEQKLNWQEHSIEKTEHKVRYHLELFIKVVGDMPANMLQRTHTVKFKDTLLGWPKNMGKLPKYKNMSIDDISNADIPPEERIATPTIKGYIIIVISFLDWGEANGYFVAGLESPLRNAKKGLKSMKRANEKRGVFSIEDLKKFFLSNPTSSL